MYTDSIISSPFFTESVCVEGGWLIKKIFILRAKTFLTITTQSETKSFLGQNSSRTLITNLSQLCDILLILIRCFWKINLSIACEGSVVLVVTLSSAAVWFLPLPGFGINKFRQNTVSVLYSKPTSCIQLLGKRYNQSNIWMVFFF